MASFCSWQSGSSFVQEEKLKASFDFLTCVVIPTSRPSIPQDFSCHTDPVYTVPSIIQRPEITNAQISVIYLHFSVVQGRGNKLFCEALNLHRVYQINQM